MPAPRGDFYDTHKGFFDYFKHITTLNTAAILIMVGFFEKAFKNPKGILLIVIAFSCFILSLICSVSTMYNFATTIAREDVRISPKKNKFKIFLSEAAFYLSKYGFIIGMILLALLWDYKYIKYTLW